MRTDGGSGGAGASALRRTRAMRAMRAAAADAVDGAGSSTDHPDQATCAPHRLYHVPHGDAAAAAGVGGAERALLRMRRTDVPSAQGGGRRREVANNLKFG